MKHFFEYNWQVRDEWFEILKTISEEELHKKRVGGVGTIAFTLYHIIEVEYAWIVWDLQGKVEPYFGFEDYQTLDKLIDLSQKCRKTVAEFIDNWQPEMEYQRIETPGENNEIENFAMGEVMRHVIAHEIHHIGQLSVWAREIGFKPPSSNLIRCGIF